MRLLIVIVHKPALKPLSLRERGRGEGRDRTNVRKTKARQAHSIALL